MPLLTLANISVSFGPEDVLEGISGAVTEGDRIGLVGRNGAGKTTLLHILAGSLKPDDGARHLARGVRTALVEQVPPTSASERSLRHEALSGIGALLELERELHAAADALGAGEPGADERYAFVQQRFEEAGGFTYPARLESILAGLGFARSELDAPVSVLSGGQRSRLALAKALLAEPDLLLMDEPTNHLDFGGLAWLEDFLRRWPGALVVTSHDRWFLDSVVNQVWYLEGRRMRSYRGNYSKFQEVHAAELERRRAEHEAQQEFIAREEAFIRRYRAGQRAREARGRATRLARLERVEAPSRQRTAAIKLSAGRSGDLVLELKGLAAGYGEAVVLEAGDAEAVRGDRIALIGPNGTGKTTLLRTLAGELRPVRGSVRRGSRVHVAHYWQEAEDLDESATVLDELLSRTDLGLQASRDLLGLMLFSGEDVFKPVAALSGGERSRLALARLSASGANLLLLDEPTNHLDIPSREALEEALDSYPGTLVFASHDRRLISRLATRLWLVEDGRLAVFDGTWEEYQESRQPAAPAEASPAQEAAAAPARPAPGSVNEYQRRLLVERLEDEIAAREAELAELSAELERASADADVARLAGAGRRFSDVQAELAALLERWAEAADGGSG